MALDHGELVDRDREPVARLCVACAAPPDARAKARPVLGHIARERGMATVARESGLGRESLYKALAPGAKPRYDALLARAVGVRLSASV